MPDLEMSNLDPLGRPTQPLLRQDYRLLGLPLLVETNAPGLADRAGETFGHWGCPDLSASAEGLRLRLLLHHRAETLPPQVPPPIMRVQEDYFLLSVGQSLGFADRQAGFAAAYITSALMDHPEMVRACFVECLGMFLACGRGRSPLHAAGVQWAGRGVLLTGRDGAGKSTLAYACLRAGFHLLAEDMVYAPESQPQDESEEGRQADRIVWGDSRSLHLLVDALQFFPELQNAPSIQQLNGETKLRIQIKDLFPDAPITQMPVWGVCSVGRSRGADTHLLESDPATILHALTHFKGDPPLDANAQQVAAQRLLRGKTAHIEVGSDLQQAVVVLKRWIEQG